MSDPGASWRFRIGLIVAGLLFAFLCLPMIRGQVAVHGDLSYYFLPLRSFFAACLASGDDPSWCPNLFGGFFLAGEGGGIAHPLVRLLYVCLPLNLAFNVEMVWSYPVLFAGLVFLLGRWGVRRDAAVFGGILFAFGGYNLLHYMHISVMGVLAHVPWLLLATDVVLRSADPRRVFAARVGVAFLTASQLLMAHVQFIWISALGEAIYVIALVCLVPGSARRLPALAVSKALGVLAGSVQLLPLWDAFRDSKRVQPSPTFVAMGSLPPLGFLQWVAPYLSISRVVTPPMAVDEGILAPAPSMYDWRVHEFSVYYGAVTPALLIGLLIRRKELGSLRPLAIVAVVLAAISLLLALGDNTPLFWLTTKIPVVGRFRIPARYLVLFHLSVAMLGAIAFGSLTRSEARPSWRQLWPLILPPMLSVLACLAPRLPEGLWPPYLRGAYLASTGLMIAGPVLVGLGTALVAGTARGSTTAAAALLVFVALDQGIYGAQMMALNPPRTVTAFLEARPSPTGASGDRVRFDQLHMTQQNQYTMKGLRLIQGYLALVPQKALTYDTPASLRVAGVSWALPAHEERSESWQQVPGALPRARLVSEVRRSVDPNRDLSAINVETTALVDDSFASSLPTSAPGRARLVVDRPGKLTVATQAPSRQLLVVSESYHQGWLATIDGRRSQVFRVNGDFLGCLVPEGEHQVNLRFRPWSQRAGLWLSMLGVVLMVAVPALPLRTKSTGRPLLARYRVMGGLKERSTSTVC